MKRHTITEADFGNFENKTIIASSSQELKTLAIVTHIDVMGNITSDFLIEKRKDNIKHEVSVSLTTSSFEKAIETYNDL